MERSVYQDGKFTFFRLGTPEAQSTNVPIDGSAGKLTAQFIPEAQTRGKLFADDLCVLGAAKPEPIGEEAGGTGLTGKSEQTFGDADDIYTYDPSASVHIALSMKCEADFTPEDLTKFPTTQRLRILARALERELEDAEAGEDYLSPDHFKKMRQMVGLAVDLKLAERDEAQVIQTSLNASYAEFKVLPYQSVECPKCKKESRVPEGLGYLRIRCPHCSAQFVRKV